MLLWNSLSNVMIARGFCTFKPISRKSSLIPVLILFNLKACITAHLLKQGVSTVPTSVTDLNVGDNSVVVTLRFNAKMDLAD